MKLNVDKNQEGIIVSCPECKHIFNVSITKIASELGSLGGLKRKANLSDRERSDQASKASKARWSKVSKITTDIVDKKIVNILLGETK